MKKIILLLLFALIACTKQPSPEQPQSPCSPLQVWTGSECCYDLNENQKCDKNEPEIKQALRDAEKARLQKLEEQRKARLARLEKARRTIVDDYIDFVQENVTSYSYVFGSDHYFVDGNSIKIELGNSQLLGQREISGKNTSIIVDNIYLDVDEKTGFAVCERYEELIGRGVHSQCEIYKGQKFEVLFDDFYKLTPLDWLVLFSQKRPFEMIENQYVVQRFTTMWAFRSDGKETRLWIDNAYKLPVRVQISNGVSEHYLYTDLKTK